MAYNFPEGSKIFLGTTFAAAINVSAVTNASTAVATTATNTYATNDELLFTSGWEDATDSIWKISAATSTTATLAGLDSTDTNWYPAGTGTGTLQKVTAWQEVTQILNISSSGGDARFTNIDPLSRRNSIAVPTGFNAQTITLTIGYDPSLAGYQALLTASRTLSKRAFKLLLSGGQVGYGYGYVSVSEMPALNRNQANTVQAAISLLGKFVGYTS